VFFVLNFWRQNFKPNSQLCNFWRQIFGQKIRAYNADEIDTGREDEVVRVEVDALDAVRRGVVVAHQLAGRAGSFDPCCFSCSIAFLARK